MRHTIAVLVENHVGVLANVAGLFSARGFNIDSLAVGETQDPTVSRMTIISTGDDRIVEQIIKQLNKLIDVIKVVDLSEEEMIDRELVKVLVNGGAVLSDWHALGDVPGGVCPGSEKLGYNVLAALTGFGAVLVCGYESIRAGVRE